MAEQLIRELTVLNEVCSRVEVSEVNEEMVSGSSNSMNRNASTSLEEGETDIARGEMEEAGEMTTQGRYCVALQEEKEEQEQEEHSLDTIRKVGR